jgi:isopentenyl-diphosphate delta-isomerase type 1
MAELLDVVNQEDTVLSQALRSVVHQRGLWHRGVHVFLFEEAGKLLLQKRSAQRSAYPAVWDCSVSEHVKAGESYAEAAQRGMQEELGVSGVDIQALIKFKMNYGPDDNEISTLYRGVVDPALVKFDPVEIEQVDWIRENQLMEWASQEAGAFAGWFLQLLSWSRGNPSEVQVLETFSTDRLFPKASRPGADAPVGHTPR